MRTKQSVQQLRHVERIANVVEDSHYYGVIARRLSDGQCLSGQCLPTLERIFLK